MNRLSVFCRMAKDLAKLSKCYDRGVSAVILDKDLTQVYSIGVNGGARGGLQCLCQGPTRYTCVHAEINALVKLTQIVEDKVMICTLSPCIQCAAAIINAPGSFKKLYYLEEWKNTEAISMLEAHGIHCKHITTVEYTNGESVICR